MLWVPGKRSNQSGCAQVNLCSYIKAFQKSGSSWDNALELWSSNSPSFPSLATCQRVALEKSDSEPVFFFLCEMAK